MHIAIAFYFIPHASKISQIRAGELQEKVAERKAKQQQLLQIQQLAAAKTASNERQAAVKKRIAEIEAELKQHEALFTR